MVAIASFWTLGVFPFMALFLGVVAGQRLPGYTDRFNTAISR